jgi:hypothetical protein
VRPVLSHCHVAHGQRYGAVISGRLTTVAVSHEWSTGMVLHCSRMFSHLTSHDGAACLHVSQALIAQTRVPWKHARVLWKYASAPWKYASLSI